MVRDEIWKRSTDKRIMKCEICGKECKSFRGLSQHIRRYHSEISNKIGGNDKYNLILLRIKLHDEISHIDVKPSLKLTKIIRSVFSDKVLVLVDIRGYKFLRKDLEEICCKRITSKSPRCKYNRDL